MTPQDIAFQILEELEDALIDFDGAEGLHVRGVSPPDDLAADTFFVVTVSGKEREPTEIELPTPLAIAYLADEEAAVDEWRLWVRAVAQRHTP
jgi:hypothetical protein